MSIKKNIIIFFKKQLHYEHFLLTYILCNIYYQQPDANGVELKGQ